MSEAWNENARVQTGKQIETLNRLGWYHSIELPDGSVIEGLQDIERLRKRLTYFPIPDDLRGKRVLDIGAWDGWFSFEMERRGAEVVAFDSVKIPRFLAAKELLNSKVEYVIGDICRTGPKQLGYFDIVLFLGVLYHVKHPMQALENVCAMTRELACIESYVTDNGENLDARPVLEFYEGEELRGQFDNWVGPNTPCLIAMTRATGFGKVEYRGVYESRGHVVAWRKWQEPPGTGPAPKLLNAEHFLSPESRFSVDSDDYISLWFKAGVGSSEALHCDNVYVEIGPYAVRPVGVKAVGVDGWTAMCKLPVGLTPGWYDVTVRHPGSATSNACRIPVSVSEEEIVAASQASGPVGDIEIAGLTDGKSWTPVKVQVGQAPGEERWMSLWLRGVPDHCKAKDVTVQLNGETLAASYLAGQAVDGLRQVNVPMPAHLQPGPAVVTATCLGKITPAWDVELVASL